MLHIHTYGLSELLKKKGLKRYQDDEYHTVLQNITVFHVCKLSVLILCEGYNLTVMSDWACKKI